MKKTFLTLLLFCTLAVVQAQNLAQYEYVRVPEKFEFSDEENEYQLNALTEFLFEKYGFEALYKEPDPANASPCDILSADVKNESNLFRSKVYVTLRNCRNEIVFTSETGSSNEKDYKKGYHEALREAFHSFEDLSFSEDDAALSDEGPDLVPTPAAKPQVEGRIDPEKTDTSDDTAEVPADVLIPEPSKMPQVEVDREESGDAELYAFANQLYSLEPTVSGFGIFHPDTKEKIATLAKSANGENYIFSSEAINGNAFFDDQENLIVEYINDLGELVTRTYERRD